MSQTELEASLQTIINTFLKYAMQTKPYNRLSKAEFANLMKEQLPNFFKDSRTSGASNWLFKELDKDGNRQVSLKEFMKFMSLLGETKFEQDD